MDPLVPNQVGNLREGLSAPRMVAWVWLLFVVHSGMFLQGGVLRKCLVT